MSDNFTARKIDFRLYTSDFSQALSIFLKIESFSEGYSPRLSSVVGRGWNVRCYMTKKDAETASLSCPDGPKKDDGGSSEIWTFDYIKKEK